MRSNNGSLDSFSSTDFNSVYKEIIGHLTEGKYPDREHCTVVLGGQPGAGKSSFYRTNNNLDNHIAINGDDFRIRHPNYEAIVKHDPEHYSELTQPFCNQVVEKLIEDLGNKGYNLIIEGTLRNPNVSINTCELLNTKGYHTDLVVVACDAETAWKSTISRAHIDLEKGNFPRLVSIDIYNQTVHRIPQSIETIKTQKCFDSITIINREGNILYRETDAQSPSKVLKEELHLDNWDTKYRLYEEKFDDERVEILDRFKEAIENTDIDIEDNAEDDIEDEYGWDNFER